MLHLPLFMNNSESFGQTGCQNMSGKRQNRSQSRECRNLPAKAAARWVSLLHSVGFVLHCCRVRARRDFQDEGNDVRIVGERYRARFTDSSRSFPAGSSPPDKWSSPLSWFQVGLLQSQRSKREGRARKTLIHEVVTLDDDKSPVPSSSHHSFRRPSSGPYLARPNVDPEVLIMKTIKNSHTAAVLPLTERQDAIIQVGCWKTFHYCKLRSL